MKPVGFPGSGFWPLRRSRVAGSTAPGQIRSHGGNPVHVHQARRPRGKRSAQGAPATGGDSDRSGIAGSASDGNWSGERGPKASRIKRSRRIGTGLGNSRPRLVNLDSPMPDPPRARGPNRSVSDLVMSNGIGNADFGMRVGRMPLAERDGESPIHRQYRGAKRRGPKGRDAASGGERRRHGSAATMRRSPLRTRRTAEAGRSEGAARRPGVKRRALEH